MVKNNFTALRIVCCLFLSVYCLCCCAQRSTALGAMDLSYDTTAVSIPYFSGLEAYHSFRIPTLIKSNNALIAFAEGRKNSTSDFGDIDLVYRRSLDGGRTWEALNILYDLDSLAVQNPVPIFVASETSLITLSCNSIQISSENEIPFSYVIIEIQLNYLL